MVRPENEERRERSRNDDSESSHRRTLADRREKSPSRRKTDDKHDRVDDRRFSHHHSPSRSRGDEDSHHSRHRDIGNRDRDRGRHSDGRRSDDRHRRSEDARDRRPRRDSEEFNIRKVKEEPKSDDEQPTRRKRGRQDKEEEKHEWGKAEVKEEEDGAPVEKQKPNFGLSGKLTEEKNVFNGVVVKYSEPPEARVPKRRWRFYVFKGEESLPTLYLHRQSAFLLGRDRKVADIPIDHPSCSKQQAVLQFRLVSYERPDGTSGRTVRPYIIDLESANGTFVNGQKIEAKRYVELFEKDVIKFGFSSREYVLLHEDSKAEAGMDDGGQD